MFTNSVFPQLRSNRRDHVLIVSDILSCAVRGVKKTELMYKAGLSSAQLNKYMHILVESELLETSDQERGLIFRTTVKGKDFLQAFGRLVRLLDPSLLSEHLFRETT